MALECNVVVKMKNSLEKAAKTYVSFYLYLLYIYLCWAWPKHNRNLRRIPCNYSSNLMILYFSKNLNHYPSKKIGDFQKIQKAECLFVQEKLILQDKFYNLQTLATKVAYI